MLRLAGRLLLRLAGSFLLNGLRSLLLFRLVGRFSRLGGLGGFGLLLAFVALCGLALVFFLFRVGVLCLLLALLGLLFLKLRDLGPSATNCMLLPVTNPLLRGCELFGLGLFAFVSHGVYACWCVVGDLSSYEPCTMIRMLFALVSVHVITCGGNPGEKQRSRLHCHSNFPIHGFTTPCLNFL